MFFHEHHRSRKLSWSVFDYALKQKHPYEFVFRFVLNSQSCVWVKKQKKEFLLLLY